MWGLELVAIVVAIIIVVSIIESAESFVEGFGGFLFVCALVAICFADGLARQSQRGCGSLVDKSTGLYSGIPYETVGDTAKDNGKMFAFVRIINGTDTSFVRCVETKVALPKRFFVGSGGTIVSLLSSDTVPQATQ
jgi:hypothetical protein